MSRIIDARARYAIITDKLPTEEEIINKYFSYEYYGIIQPAGKHFKEIFKEIERLEKESFYWINDQHTEYVEVWNEGLSSLYHKPSECVWPEEWSWTNVYVVTGGSEGYWLHVDIAKDRYGNNNELNTRNMFIGKSLCLTWMECWQSACRIAWWLGA